MRYVTIHSKDTRCAAFYFPERGLMAYNACADADAHIFQLVFARDLRPDLAAQLLDPECRRNY